MNSIINAQMGIINTIFAQSKPAVTAQNVTHEDPRKIRFQVTRGSNWRANQQVNKDGAIGSH
jgi:hypothetical protein